MFTTPRETSVNPSGVLAALGPLLTLASLWRRPSRPPRVLWQAAIALGSFGALWFAGASAFARDSMSSLPIHMVSHIIVMFLVPIGLVYSGSARSFWWILSVATRRRLLRWWYLRRRWRAPRVLAHPLTAAVVLNAVMVMAHSPRVFDAIMEHGWSMDWIMEPVFLLSGLYFFHFLVTSPPRVNRVRLRWQLAMVLMTMAEMVVLAMAMAIFTRHSWYSVMDPIPGMPAMPGMGMHAATLAQAFSDQQLAAAILWICGDFWAVPCLVAIVRRVIAREGSLLAALDRSVDHQPSAVA